MCAYCGHVWELRLRVGRWVLWSVAQYKLDTQIRKVGLDAWRYTATLTMNHFGGRAFYLRPLKQSHGAL